MTETLWLCDIDFGGSGLYGLHETRNAAIEAGREDAGHWADCTIEVAPVKLCDESDPDIYQYDSVHDSYFKLVGPVETVKRFGSTW